MECCQSLVFNGYIKMYTFLNAYIRKEERLIINDLLSINLKKLEK